MSRAGPWLPFRVPRGADIAPARPDVARHGFAVETRVPVVVARISGEMAFVRAISATYREAERAARSLAVRGRRRGGGGPDGEAMLWRDYVCGTWPRRWAAGEPLLCAELVQLEQGCPAPDTPVPTLWVGRWAGSVPELGAPARALRPGLWGPP